MRTRIKRHWGLLSIVLALVCIGILAVLVSSHGRLCYIKEMGLSNFIIEVVQTWSGASAAVAALALTLLVYFQIREARQRERRQERLRRLEQVEAFVYFAENLIAEAKSLHEKGMPSVEDLKGRQHYLDAIGRLGWQLRAEHAKAVLSLGAISDEQLPKLVPDCGNRCRKFLDQYGILLTQDQQDQTGNAEKLAQETQELLRATYKRVQQLRETYLGWRKEVY